MATYRKKATATVQATRWLGHGSHPAVEAYRYALVSLHTHERGKGYTSTEAVGWIETKQGGVIVYPGDWIITQPDGENYPCNHELFIDTYELAGPDLGTNKD